MVWKHERNCLYLIGLCSIHREKERHTDRYIFIKIFKGLTGISDQENYEVNEREFRLAFIKGQHT